MLLRELRLRRLFHNLYHMLTVRWRNMVQVHMQKRPAGNIGDGDGRPGKSTRSGRLRRT